MKAGSGINHSGSSTLILGIGSVFNGLMDPDSYSEYGSRRRYLTFWAGSGYNEYGTETLLISIESDPEVS